MKRESKSDQRKRIIKKWKDAGLLDGKPMKGDVLTRFKKLLEAKPKQKIPENPTKS